MMTDQAQTQARTPLWSDERLAVVERGLEKGTPYAEIGHALGVTRSTVAGVVDRYFRRPGKMPAGAVTASPAARRALPPPQPVTLRKMAALPPEEIEQVKAEILANTHTLAEIAHKHGVSRPMIQNLSNDMGGRGNTSSKRAVEDAALRERIKRRREALAGPAYPGFDPARFADGFEGQRGRVALTELRLTHCRFPIDLPDGSTRFCGLDVEGKGASYCSTHAARCYRETSR